MNKQKERRKPFFTGYKPGFFFTTKENNATNDFEVQLIKLFSEKSKRQEDKPDV